MKLVNVTIKEAAQVISSFAAIGEVFILEESLAIEVLKILDKHKTKKFKMSTNEHYANIWRTK